MLVKGTAQLYFIRSWKNLSLIFFLQLANDKKENFQL